MESTSSWGENCQWGCSFIFRWRRCYFSIELERFIEPLLKKEQDVILNNIDSVCFEKMRVEWPSIAMVYRKIVNDVLGRMDLKYDSMLSMPYAITKKQLKTLDMISCSTLFYPK